MGSYRLSIIHTWTHLHQKKLYPSCQEPCLAFILSDRMAYVRVDVVPFDLNASTDVWIAVTSAVIASNAHNRYDEMPAIRHANSLGRI